MDRVTAVITGEPGRWVVPSACPACGAAYEYSAGTGAGPDLIPGSARHCPCRECGVLFVTVAVTE